MTSFAFRVGWTGVNMLYTFGIYNRIYSLPLNFNIVYTSILTEANLLDCLRYWLRYTFNVSNAFLFLMWPLRVQHRQLCQRSTPRRKRPGGADWVTECHLFFFFVFFTWRLCCWDRKWFFPQAPPTPDKIQSFGFGNYAHLLMNWQAHSNPSSQTRLLY